MPCHNSLIYVPSYVQGMRIQPVPAPGLPILQLNITGTHTLGKPEHPRPNFRSGVTAAAYAFPGWTNTP